VDVRCLNCREPWDTYHLRHDALSEVIPFGAPKGAAAKWDGKLDSVVWSSTARVLLRDDKWEFGDSINDVRRCPCCPKKGVLRQSMEDQERADLRAELCGLMPGDDDGIACVLEGFDL